MSAICPHGIVSEFVCTTATFAGEAYVDGGCYWHSEDERCDLKWVPVDVSEHLGKTGYCLHGRHKQCSHRVGGPASGGILLSTGEIYRCPCDCHNPEPRTDLEARLQKVARANMQPITQLSLFPERTAP